MQKIYLFKKFNNLFIQFNNLFNNLFMCGSYL